MFRPSMLILMFALSTYCVSSVCALDTGILQHFLNIDMKLPLENEAISPSEAVEAVRAHISSLKASGRPFSQGMKDYNADYAAVLKEWIVLSSAKPVMLEKDDGESLISRFLVGFVKDGKVGGFFSVNSNNGHVQTELMWTAELQPLWTVSETV